MRYLQKKKVILATKHHKEKVIAPHFEKALGCKIIVPDHYDTDQFGTFTGEVPRLLPPDEMVIKKAQNAMEKFQIDYGIASEGSFGPHPFIPFAPLHQELLAFVDSILGIHIIVKENTINTNYAFYDFKPGDNLEKILEQTRFSSHALIVRTLACGSVVAKGICEEENLHQIISKAFALSPEGIRIETDMRALYNPTRMKVISNLALKLIERIQTHCQNCGSYGFGELSFHGFLPCEACDRPSEFYKNQKESCLKCNFSIEKPRADQRTLADPQFCQYCNP